MKKLRKKPTHLESNWTTDQDGFLIEHSSLSIQELMLNLPFTGEEIQTRKETLGLFRRQRQMMKNI